MAAPESPSHQRLFTMDGPNGPIGAAAWDGPGPVAVLLAGVNGSTASWTAVADLVAGRRGLVAVDLRGRGRSPAHGPWGVDAHADDVAAVASQTARETGEPVTLVGHSFGAHVAASAARRSTKAVADLVLVDGGLPRRIPPDTSADEAIDGALGNILPHLDGLGFPVSAEAVAADFRSMIVDDEATTALAATTQPVMLIRAGNGVAVGLPPIVDDDTLAELRAQRPVDTELVADANHFTLLGDHASVVVEAIVGGSTMKP